MIVWDAECAKKKPPDENGNSGPTAARRKKEGKHVRTGDCRIVCRQRQRRTHTIHRLFTILDLRWWWWWCGAEPACAFKCGYVSNPIETWNVFRISHGKTSIFHRGFNWKLLTQLSGTGMCCVRCTERTESGRAVHVDYSRCSCWRCVPYCVVWGPSNRTSSNQPN